MNVLPIILTELWMDEYPKCPVRDKTNTEESPINALQFIFGVIYKLSLKIISRVVSVLNNFSVTGDNRNKVKVANHSPTRLLFSLRVHDL